MTTARTRSVFLWGLVGSLCVTAALAIGTLLFAEFDDTAGRILATTAFLSLASLLSLPAGVLLDQRRALPFPWGVLAAAAAALAVSLATLWSDADPEWPWKLSVTFWLAAGWGAQVASTTALRRPQDGAWLTRLYAVAALLALALAVMFGVLVWEGADNDAYARALGAVAVATVLTSLLQPIVRRARQTPGPGARLVLRLDREPSDEAVADAVDALERHGIAVEEVVGRQV